MNVTENVFIGFDKNFFVISASRPKFDKLSKCTFFECSDSELQNAQNLDALSDESFSVNLLANWSDQYWQLFLFEVANRISASFDLKTAKESPLKTSADDVHWNPMFLEPKNWIVQIWQIQFVQVSVESWKRSFGELASFAMKFRSNVTIQTLDSKEFEELKALG